MFFYYYLPNVRERDFDSTIVKNMSSSQEPEDPIKYLEMSSKYIKHYPDENLINKEEIASGGFGVVHKATDKLSGITVAMKSLRPVNKNESGKIYAAFVQEVSHRVFLLPISFHELDNKYQIIVL